MMAYYELHVTMLGSTERIKSLCEVIRWTFSKIDGDPNLGAGVKCYATRQISSRRTEEAAAIKCVEETASYFRNAGITVLRVKVELVVYDRRTPRDRE